MSDYQKPCGYPVMDCALGVYVTKCENRIEELEVAIKRQASASKKLRSFDLERTRHLEAIDRSEYTAAKTLDSERQANEMLTDHIEELEVENEKLRKGLEIYQRERDRFRHANPEMTGAYFLSGGHGIKDDNQMPQFVEVVPTYGCGWSMIYEDTGRIISYEGS